MAGGKDPSARLQGLKTQANELVKQFIVYDVNGRPTQVYTAHTDAVQDTPCTLVTYQYVGASSRVEKMKESNATWDVSYD
jgi:hypothetical protein